MRYLVLFSVLWLCTAIIDSEAVFLPVKKVNLGIRRKVEIPRYSTEKWARRAVSLKNHLKDDMT